MHTRSKNNLRDQGRSNVSKHEFKRVRVFSGYTDRNFVLMMDLVDQSIENLCVQKSVRKMEGQVFHQHTEVHLGKQL